jgi:hypothetical protein
MRIRLTVVAIAAGAMLLVPATARAGDLGVDYGHDGADFVRYWATGPAQDVTIDAKYPGNPALTGDEPGAQRIDYSDAAERVRATEVAGTTVPFPEPAGCSNVTEHTAFCLADPQKEAEWRTSTCYFPPGCTGPGPSGLLIEAISSLYGSSVKVRDTQGAEPIDERLNLYGGGTHQTTLWSARGLEYNSWGDATDRVFLHLQPLPLRVTWRPRSVDTGPGDDFVFARDGTPEYINCGDGTDTVIAGPEDTVNADCENVFVG